LCQAASLLNPLAGRYRPRILRPSCGRVRQRGLAREPGRPKATRRGRWWWGVLVDFIARNQCARRPSSLKPNALFPSAGMIIFSRPTLQVSQRRGPRSGHPTSHARHVQRLAVRVHRGAASMPSRLADARMIRLERHLFQRTRELLSFRKSWRMRRGAVHRGSRRISPIEIFFFAAKCRPRAGRNVV